jgi:hypothetical protein
MRNIIVWFLIPTLIACNNSSKIPDMAGTYLMQSQILNDGKNDTKLTGLKQLKVYTDSFFMYTQVNPHDSVSAFGVGTYTTDTGSVTENVIFSSSGSTVNTPAIYNLKIEKTQDGYNQVIPEMTVRGDKYKLTEDYLAVGPKTKSPLDGVWKEIKSYIITGKDTVINKRIQYKTFYGGYFMFGHSLKDSSSVDHTGIGFGTFEMISDNQFKETDLNSTYSIIAGQTFNIGIKMDDADHYNQTIIDSSSGGRSIEFYERLKK